MNRRPAPTVPSAAVRPVRRSARTARSVFASAAAVGALALAGCGGEAAADSSAGSSEWPDPFVVAVIPSEDRTELDPADSPVMQILQDELGVEIEYHTATSYAATIEAQRSGQAHMAYYGPFSYVLAADSGAGVEPVAAAADSADEQGGYHSVASVRADSDIESLEDAAGKSVCFVDPASTSGYLFPSAGLIEAGIDPEGSDINPVMSGGHDASVLALVDGQCDIAFSTEGMAKEQLVDSGQIAEGDIKQVWKSEVIPSNPYAVTSSLPEDFKQAIADTLVEKVNVDAIKGTEYWDDSAEDEFGGLGRWGYMPVDDSAYDGIRSVCETTQSESCAAAE
jgi:phosphonate transport system substrate-binding protein